MHGIRWDRLASRSGWRLLPHFGQAEREAMDRTDA
jgi:hypothetical protein